MTTPLGTRPPRWRCNDPACPHHRWQPVRHVGEFDVVDAALEELERHWRDHHHHDQTGRAAA